MVHTTDITTTGSEQWAQSAWISRSPEPITSPSIPSLKSSPLQGLRFAVKDNIDVVGYPVTAACPAFSYQPTENAHVVQKLLNAGAQCVGKTNLDQFACGLNGTRSPYGVVPNPFHPAYLCGGSSSGSAYVVATGQVDFALGTDTAGSGRVPAGFNNIVGLKPSKGLLSLHGVVPAAQSVDCVSIFARSVGLAAQVLQATMGFDARDSGSRHIALHSLAWGQSFTFGIPDTLDFDGDTLAQAEFTHAITRMQSLGGIPVRIPFQPLTEAASMLYDSALVTERYHGIRDFFDQHAQAVMEPVRSIIAQGKAYSAADLIAAQSRLRSLAQQATTIWQQIDVLLVPTAPRHYTIAEMQADPVERNRKLGCYTNFVNLLDYAALSVPASMRPDGLPFGVTLIAPCGSDWQLVELGQRFHSSTALLQGALKLPLPALLNPLPGLNPAPAEATLPLAVVGAHLSGMPLNGQLIERGATLLQATHTAAHYRLFALPNTQPPKPGLKRVSEDGAAIAIEVWNMPLSQLGGFLALIPPPLGLGSLELADGTWVHGFICEGYALEGAMDVTAFGGWRAFIQARKQT
jgi:allophanate hydrolase